MSVLTAVRTPAAQHARRVAIILILLAMLALAACASPRPPDAEPTIRGVIVDLTPGPDGTGLALIVWHESLGEVYELDSIAATIGEETELFDRGGTIIDFADLKVRDVVDAWFSGPIAESYPPQGTADAVRVIGGFDEIRPLPIPRGLIEP
ncbi:MAG: YobA family protein [Coriobacteriia bacterium]|nr:YobA family protein [Coriobacteriia bacterium]